MLELTCPIELQRPPLLHFGAGTVAHLADWAHSRDYKQPFIVADPINAARLDQLGLGDIRCFGDVTAEPDTVMLERAVAAAAGADLVIGFGGGSAMDLAKLVAVMVGRTLRLEEISGPNRAPEREVGLAQIPTTAGTGSEVGTRALITNPKTFAKIATESVHMLADIAIIDPALTQSVPPFVTAATGVDAMAHCVESYTSKRAHPLIDGYALQGIELVGKYLKRAVDDGSDTEARAGMALASFYGGVCLGPVNTTAGHAVSYPLARYKIPHGIANALIFPHVLAANAQAAADKTARIGAALGFETGTSQQVLDGAMDFCRALGLDMRLRAHGVPKDDLADMAKDAHGIRRLLDWNPVDLSVEEILAIYERAW
ncbi:alcohol dehydrogenase class IV [Breoghania corrubedonensis]|uniref:Alcohol dehydrogenase class IV n=1 Tax=Breoghania corrubedonensis TaxID=665038 RepID=A0A2T5VHH5_9HYPH|nr:iron-containing alcohol dehydrogenase [Breoghania corrubedonensis]PTW63210.1 alcohol dehydrogenase class IV [Breoghania corrubedonensis]